MRGLDLSSWQAVGTTVVGLLLITLVGVGIRLLVMQTVQQRRQRQNRQINERLRTLIAAYKTLGGSFTGDLEVDPLHRRDAARDGRPERPGGERRRRVRDAVEAALSDVILLGTEEQVRLAVRAVQEMVAGRRVELAELVVSLRTFIREVLDLDPVPPGLDVPRQGPGRVAAAGNARGGGRGAGGGDGGASGGGGGAGGGGGGGAGLALGSGALGAGLAADGSDRAA